MKIAVFDIGTNSIHLLIVEVYKDLSFDILGHEKDVTRLGDGSFEEKMLTEDAMTRGLDVMERFYKIAKSSQVRRMVAVATSAVREAKNGGEFVNRVSKRTGLKVQVITGEEEARLISLGAKSSVETRGKRALVVDIGGGSMELILGVGEKNLFLESYKLGVARLTDHFISHDPPTKKELRKLETHIVRTLKKPVKKIRKIGFSMVIGTAGTMINLASVSHEREEDKPLDLVNHYTLKTSALEKVHEELAASTQYERIRMPGLDPKRADIIVAGSVLVSTLTRLLKTDRIILSDKGIREGIILDFIEKNKKRIKGEEEIPNIRERSVWQLARRYAVDEDHAKKTAELADMIFQGTRRLHRLGPEARELLSYACLLHDIGYHVSFQKHHKHSYYLIVNSDLDGFTPEEVRFIAATARYHRKQLPKKTDTALLRLKKSNQHAMKVLAAILRIADGLDRTHFSVIKSLRCRVTPKALRLVVKTRQDWEIEHWQANERADLFKQLFRRKVEIFKEGK